MISLLAHYKHVNTRKYQLTGKPVQFTDLKQGIKSGGLAIKPITNLPSLWQANVISQDHRVFHPSHQLRLTLEALE